MKIRVSQTELMNLTVGKNLSTKPRYAYSVIKMSFTRDHTLEADRRQSNK
jgi:hypothetical protein